MDKSDPADERVTPAGNPLRRLRARLGGFAHRAPRPQPDAAAALTLTGLDAAVLLARLDNPLIVLDADARLVGLNPAAETLLGYRESAWLGSDWWQLVADADAGERLRVAFRRLCRSGGGDLGEQRWRSRDGARVPLHVAGATLPAAGGVWAVLNCHVLSRYRHNLEILRSERQRYRDYAVTAADWFWELDAERRLRYLSPSHAAITGEPAERLYGQTLPQLLRRHGLPSVQLARLTASLDGGRPFRRVSYAWRRADGASRVLQISGMPLLRDGRVSGFRGSGSDVTAAYRLTRRLTREATHDALTGLVNRREFEQRLDRALTSARAGAPQALLYLDLDRFKTINDSAGHDAGDALLRELGTRLRRSVRSRDTLARLGGDEFAVLIEHGDRAVAARVADALRHSVESFRFRWRGRESGFQVGVSIGVALIGADAGAAGEVMRAADSACYTAKRAGSGVHFSGDPQPGEQRRRRDRVARGQTRALQEDRLSLLAQPVVPLRGGDGGDGVELLLRLRGDDGRLLTPPAFWPLAERLGAVGRLDRWVVRAAFGWLAGGADGARPALCFINVAAASLAEEDFPDYVAAQLDASGIDPAGVCFDITDAAVAAPAAATGHAPAVHGARFIDALRVYGCRFALQGYGRGAFALDALQTLPVDFLKLDRGLVRGVADDPVERRVVRSLHEIGDAFGKTTIAGYVEDEPTLNALRALGVGYVQGYHTGRPRALGV